jgi:phosphate transport system substrate-binding protein
VRYITLAFLALTAFCTCSRKQGGVIIAGSTSVQPFIEKVAEQFMEDHPNITISVQGGGSTAGIQATFNGTCQIGTSSRNLKVSERGLKVFLIAVDGIAVIVHNRNPVADLSIEEIRGIFANEITNWQQVGGLDQEIIPVTREEGSGTRGAFEEMVMCEMVISDACLVQDSNGAVREIIATTPQGVGYISVGLVDNREKAVSINGVYPTLSNLITCKYRFTRPFLMLFKAAPEGAAKFFLDYVLSQEGQNILKNDGLIPAGEIDSD